MYKRPISDPPDDVTVAVTENGVGAPVKRNEDARFLRGRGQYLGDLSFAGMKDVAFLRSPVAHARLGTIEVPEEYRAAVFTSEDLSDVKPIIAEAMTPGF